LLVHWDEIEPVAIDDGDLRGTRWRLGAAAGATRTGLSRYRLGPGERAMPVHPVRPGHVVARPPGTGVAHAFRAGEHGLTLLAFGTREPNDIAYYPRSRKVSLRGIGVRFHVEPVDYWDGEPG